MLLSFRRLEEATDRQERLRYLARVITLAIIYLVVAKLGLMMDAVAGFATLVWPPTGIALAALLIFGCRLWPGVAIGAFIVNVWTGAPVLVALGMSTGNTLEAVLGSYALRRFARFQPPLDRLRQTIGLIILAAIASTMVSATVGVVSLRLGAVVKSGHFFETWRTWWLGDVLGDLVMAPLLLAWSKRRRVRIQLWRLVEVGGLGAALLAIEFLVFFSQPFPESGALRRHSYMIFPVLIWAALRFGLRGSTVAMFAISAIAVWCTAIGRGPFVRSSLSESLLDLQTFMAIAAITALVLGAAISERIEGIRKREEFLAIVSHDLKGPLSAINMSTALMLKHAGEAGPVSKQVAVVQRSVERMHSLIRDLLDLAAIDAGHLSLAVEGHDARAIVSEAVELAQALAAQKSLAVEIPTPASPIPVQCDRERVLQVLSNLIGNAIKFTPDGGTILLRVEQLGRHVRFAVTDRGPGIPNEHLRHIYERFWQAQPGARLGTGLGLSIVKGFVEAHGGRVSAESKIGKGSTFYFTLPSSSQMT